MIRFLFLVRVDIYKVHKCTNLKWWLCMQVYTHIAIHQSHNIEHFQHHVWFLHTPSKNIPLSTWPLCWLLSSTISLPDIKLHINRIIQDNFVGLLSSNQHNIFKIYLCCCISSLLSYCCSVVQHCTVWMYHNTFSCAIKLWQ